MIIYNIVFNKSKNVKNNSSGYKQVIHKQKLTKIKVRPKKRRTMIADGSILQKKKVLSMLFLKKILRKKRRGKKQKRERSFFLV
jgi:hypothetical protein